MIFYKVQAMAEFSFEFNDCRWFTNRRDAEKEKLKMERDEDLRCHAVERYDIPTDRAGLLRWLNNFGNPGGMGSC